MVSSLVVCFAYLDLLFFLVLLALRFTYFMLSVSQISLILTDSSFCYAYLLLLVMVHCLLLVNCIYEESASFDSTVKIWDVELGKLLYNFNAHREPVYLIAFSPT
ncbi:hypothetical protein Droror1_Dr00017898 [Drosera rotundifolia]